MAMAKPSFFKIIVSPALQLRRLMIPDEFVKNHGTCLLSNRLYLKVPEGATTWPVEMVKQKGRVWFAKGWPEFSKHYAVSLGQFLMFRYDGNCCFLVLIFNVSATEIDYPSDTFFHGAKYDVKSRHSGVVEIEADDNDVEVNNDRDGGGSGGDGDDDASVQILDVKSPRCFKKAEIQEKNDDSDASVEILDVQSPQCFKKAKIEAPSSCPNHYSAEMDYPSNLHQRTQCDVKFQESQVVKVEDSNDDDASVEIIDVESSLCLKKVKREASSSCSNYCSGKGRIRAAENSRVKHGGSSDEKIGAMKRAMSFKSKNPYFMIYMWPSYIANKCVVHVPQSYSKTYFAAQDSTATNTMTLCLQGHQKANPVWPVRYRIHKSRVRLSTGWINFVLDNHLRVHDVCIFELVDAVDMVYKVLILRA